MSLRSPLPILVCFLLPLFFALSCQKKEDFYLSNEGSLWEWEYSLQNGIFIFPDSIQHRFSMEWIEREKKHTPCVLRFYMDEEIIARHSILSQDENAIYINGQPHILTYIHYFDDGESFSWSPDYSHPDPGNHIYTTAFPLSVNGETYYTNFFKRVQ